HPNDRQRLIRAFEVVLATGRTLADWQQRISKQNEKRARILEAFWLVVTPEREDLYRRCNERFDKMLKKGALDEARALMDLAYDPQLPVMKSLGVPDLIAHLQGKVSLDQAKESAKTKTRRYAKRQITWLRHQVVGNDQDVLVAKTKFLKSFLAKNLNIIRQKVLTPED
ncbi:MAG: tRNA dimethylallyltransferase, partial [Kiloniellales bacterium]|nr:tRNA dimethylallyltransferase [Kiloniellales bacterium]